MSRVVQSNRNLLSEVECSLKTGSLVNDSGEMEGVETGTIWKTDFMRRPRKTYGNRD